MLKTKRTLLTACAVILVCMCNVVAMTYALFTDSALIKNHLQAGTLDIEMVRTNLTYGMIDDEGYLYEDSIRGEFDFTGSTNKNVFGLDSSSLKIAPGCYFAATLELRNKGDIAFTYNIGIKMTENSQLAKQLKISVMNEDGSPILDENGQPIPSKMLSELALGHVISAGEMSASDTTERFIVLIEFVDEVDYNTPEMSDGEKIFNNSAKKASAAFDLIVTAVQATN